MNEEHNLKINKFMNEKENNDCMPRSSLFPLQACNLLIFSGLVLMAQVNLLF